MSDYVIDFNELEWQSPMKGLRFKIKKQDGRQLRLVEYSREMKPHWCEKGHYGYVIEGYLKIKFIKETTVFIPGDGIFIPQGSEHKHKVKVFSDVVRIIFVEDEEFSIK